MTYHHIGAERRTVVRKKHFKGQRYNDFVLLKALFNQDLSQAVLEKSKKDIDLIIQRDYSYEIFNRLVDRKDSIDVEFLYRSYLESIKDADELARIFL